MTDLAEKFLKDAETAIAEGRVGERGEILPTAPVAQPAAVVAPAPAATPPQPAGAAPAEPAAATPKPGEATPPTPAATPAAAAAEPEPAGVLTRDGKHVIPFTVHRELRDNLQRTTEALNEERQQRETLQQESQALRQRLEALAAQVEAAGGKRDPAVAVDPANPLAGLDLSDLPEELSKAINGIVEQNRALSAKIGDIEEREQSRAAEELEEKGSTVQALIDQNPELASWQAANGQAWEAAKAHDNRLRQNQANADLPIEDRLKRVVELTRLELSLPVFQQQQPAAGPAQPAVPPKPPLGPAEPPPPRSLSQIPGGAPPVSTEGEALINMDGQKAAAMLSKMNPKQMDEFLVKQFGA
jgi:hypothetical protein